MSCIKIICRSVKLDTVILVYSILPFPSCNKTHCPKSAEPGIQTLALLLWNIDHKVTISVSSANTRDILTTIRSLLQYDRASKNVGRTTMVGRCCGILYQAEHPSFIIY